MLEPFIKNEAGGSQLDVGMAFFILGGFYMMSAIVTGFVKILLLEKISWFAFYQTSNDKKYLLDALIEKKKKKRISRCIGIEIFF